MNDERLMTYEDKVSDCCNAEVYENDICTDCKDNCSAIDIEELGEYNNDTSLKFQYQ
jgi:hypothetical protein